MYSFVNSEAGLLTLTVFSAILFAEFCGHFVHRLLHSHRIEFLSRNHMVHHLRLYGPHLPQRSGKYLDATIGRAGVAGIGLEWIIPAAFLIGMLFVFFYLLDIRLLHQLTFVGVSVGWGVSMFAYMHGALHLENFWMLKNRIFRAWFQRARRLHDIHHQELDDSGRMSTNFGICFFWFDRLFGTFQARGKPLNERGLKQALVLYSFIYDDPQNSASTEND